MDKFSMNSEISTAQIVCRNYAHIFLNCSQCIHITNMEFIGCGGNQVKNIEEFVLQNTKFKGGVDSGTALELIETTAQIVNGTFVSNRMGKSKVVRVPDYFTDLVGGAIIATHSKIDISHSDFENNGAEVGGAIFAEQGSNITMSNTIFIGNQGIHNHNPFLGAGGAMYQTDSIVTMTNCHFEYNTASTGGVLYSENSTITIEASEFQNNAATSGGVLMDSSSSTIRIGASEFHNNTAIRDGGVLYSSSSNITIEASEFHNNNATSGGVLCSRSSNITIGASEVHNTAAWRGGALDSFNCTITVEASEFHNNNATSGGVLYFYSSNITIEASKFHNNNATRDGGVLYSYSSYITMELSEFRKNTATSGGVLDSFNSTITIERCEFHDNNATWCGGVLDSFSSAIMIESCEFHNNNAAWCGGVLDSFGSTITMEASEFHNNTATGGGVLDSFRSTVTIEVSGFYKNTATGGGVLDSRSSNTTIKASKFHSNTATQDGGVLYSSSSTITIEISDFHNNIATQYGGVLYFSSSTITISNSNVTDNNSSVGAAIYATSSSILYNSSLLIANNSAVGYAVIYLADSEYNGNVSGNAQFLNNLGSLVAFNSNITLMGYAMYVNNQEPLTTTTLANFQEGGAITLFQSNLLFDGICSLEDNHAENGGAVLSIESKVYVNGNVTIEHNTATRNGGGVYLLNSELNCQWKSTLVLFKNTATHKGGGLHAISSSIKATSASLLPYYYYIGTVLKFTENTAEKGGGLSLEANAKLYILKYNVIRVNYRYANNANSTIFTANTADYGGAVYVDDDTNSGTCASNPKTECFFQVLAIHGTQRDTIKTQSMHFSQNHARISGSTLYGGLLDRCAVSQFAEVRYKDGQYSEDRSDGVTYFKDVSTITNTSISSHPVQVCLCINNKHLCTQQSHFEVKKGETFTVSLVAVNQIGDPVNGSIQASLTTAGSCLLYTSPSPRDATLSRMPSSA